MNLTATTNIRKPPKAIYGLALFGALNLGLTLYVNSSFLSSMIPESRVGLLFTVASTLALFVPIFLPRLLRIFGNYTMTMVAYACMFILLGSFVVTNNPLFVVPLFALYIVITRIVTIQFDIFVEDASDDASTGGTRGMYYTALNFGVLISPLLAGVILTNGDFWKIYLASASIILPIMIILTAKYHNFKDPIYTVSPFFTSIKVVWSRINLRRIFCVSFLLYFFYSWMVIYMPIYLHNHIGFEWSTLGIIFTIMLLPFVLFELPLGLIADSKIGEKELLFGGFLLMGVSTAILSFITSNIVWVWALALFITRTGTSVVEIMSETYFFKKITSSDVHLIGIFRLSRILGYIVGPLLATLFLFFYDIQYIFLALGIIMLTGLYFALRLEDTM